MEQFIDKSFYQIDFETTIYNHDCSFFGTCVPFMEQSSFIFINMPVFYK